MLALGSEAPSGTDVLKGRTDAIQLIGVALERTPRGGDRASPRPLRRPARRSGAGSARLSRQEGPEGAAQEVEDLLGIAPDLVLVTGFDGFLSTMGVVGDVVVESPLAFTADDGGVKVRQGRNTLRRRAGALLRHHP